MSHDIFSEFSSEELQSALSSKLFRDMLHTMPVAATLLEAVRNECNGNILQIKSESRQTMSNVFPEVGIPARR